MEDPPVIHTRASACEIREDSPRITKHTRALGSGAVSISKMLSVICLHLCADWNVQPQMFTITSCTNKRPQQIGNRRILPKSSTATDLRKICTALPAAKFDEGTLPSRNCMYAVRAKSRLHLCAQHIVMLFLAKSRLDAAGTREWSRRIAPSNHLLVLQRYRMQKARRPLSTTQKIQP